MKVQCVGNYDCQRKKDVNFKAISAVEKLESIQNKGYVNRGFRENPWKLLTDLVWTFANGAIGLLTKAINRA
jgi:hypothetical protein